MSPRRTPDDPAPRGWHWDEDGWLRGNHPDDGGPINGSVVAELFVNTSWPTRLLLLIAFVGGFALVVVLYSLVERLLFG